MAAVSVTRADFRTLDRRFDELKQARLMREAEWQLIADVFLPRKDFSLPQKPTELRRRRLTSSVPAIALRRGASLLTGFMIDNTRPFIKANVQRGLVAAGRPTELDGDAKDYLGDVEWGVFDRMMLPQSGFLSGASRLALELYAFGTGVQWTGRKRGFGPKYLTRPLRACWIAENEDGEVDTLFYQFTMPLWKAVERWPDHGVEKWTRDAGDEGKARQSVTLTHAVYPRIGGREGAEGRAKPFAEVYFCCAEKAILGEGGYDSFPYAVPRLDVEEGSAYGTGLAWWVLPEALVLNALQQGVENAVELKNNPPLFLPKRMFGKPLDRRAGAVNAYDAAGLGFQNASQAVQKLEIAGDVAVAASYLQRLETNVESAFFIDWMRLPETAGMTATEVNDRRDLRLRAMSSFVPGIDRDWMGPTADRTLLVMGEENQLTPPPDSLSGVEVDWDYNGPLAIAQLKGQIDSVSAAMQLAMTAKELDPTAPYVFAVEEQLRVVGEALALPPETLRSRAEVAQLRARDAQARELAENKDMMQAAATALRDGGQGLSTLTGANGAQRAA